jgi:transcriptional regulator with AAA-type ATPase domain
LNIDTHTLLCWHAERAGTDVLKNTLKKLSKKATIKTVLYLVQSDSKAGKDLPEELEGAEIKQFPVELNDPTNHQAIYKFIRDQVVPIVSACESRLHINVSPGTPAMHSVWLMLFAGGAFPIGTTLWSSQYNPNTKRTSLNKIDFPITTYMAEVRSNKKLNPDLGIYEPEAKSAARQQALKLLKQYSELSGHPLLLLGERGTGKTRMVETYVSKIKQRDVVALACGGLNSSVAESLLFGHVKGAFTGADGDRTGLLGEANDKLLFLDEVQDLPRNVQRELVRTLQDKDHKYRQVGSDKELSSNFELVCASNLTFGQLRKELYPDFFDRIAHLIVEVPPLHLCRKDIQADWQQVWSECRKSERIPEKAPICDQLTDLFEEHNFSGNLRDLQRLAVLIMVWLGEESEQKAVKIAIDEWGRWERTDSTDVVFGSGSWQERTTSFQEKLALWAVRHFGSAKRAAEMLNCSERTITDHHKKHFK